MQPNAGGEPPPTAGAQRTLLAVGSSAWFGEACPCCTPSSTFHDTVLPPCTCLLDHLVRQEQERRRNRDSQGLGGLEVEDQFELRGLLHGQVRRRGALQ